MEKSKMLLKIEARHATIWNELKTTDPEIIKNLLLSAVDVKKKLDYLNDESIVNQLTKELQESFDLMNSGTIKYEGANYVWYQQDDWALGRAYEECNYTFLSNEYSGTNNDWINDNSEKPNFSGQSIDLCKLSVTLVMHVWYKELLAENQKAEYDADDYDNPQMALFDELFKLKLFSLLDTAYSRIKGKKPNYFCLSVYGYWHSEISDYIIQTS